MKTATAFACLLMVLAGCNTKTVTAQKSAEQPAEVQTATCGSITRIHSVGDFYLASQPSAEDYPLLKEMGVKSIINLRTPGETDIDGQGLAKANGMAYYPLPWKGPGQLTDEKLDEMRRLLREAKRPILLHCGSSNRVGAGWLAYRVLDEGVAVDTAVAEAKTIGMRTPEYETIARDYIKRQEAR